MSIESRYLDFDHYKSNFHTKKIIDEKGIDGLIEYLNEEQAYEVATVAATWGLGKESPFAGQLGHHVCIKLPGKRVCEWSVNGETKYDEKNSQVEVRFAPGRVIEDIWRKHQELGPKYNSWEGAEGFLSYRPFKRDCFSYVQRLLTETGEPSHRLIRIEEGALSTVVRKLVDILPF